jgi:ribosomal protein S18
MMVVAEGQNTDGNEAEEEQRNSDGASVQETIYQEDQEVAYVTERYKIDRRRITRRCAKGQVNLLVDDGKRREKVE